MASSSSVTIGLTGAGKESRTSGSGKDRESNVEEFVMFENDGSCWPLHICKQGATTKTYKARLLEKTIEHREVLLCPPDGILMSGYPKTRQFGGTLPEQELVVTDGEGIQIDLELVEHFFDYEFRVRLPPTGTSVRLSGTSLVLGDVGLVFKFRSSPGICRGKPYKSNWDCLVVHSISSEAPAFVKSSVYVGDQILAVNGDAVGDIQALHDTIMAARGDHLLFRMRVNNYRDSQYHADDKSCAYCVNSLKSDHATLAQIVCCPVVVCAVVAASAMSE
eukprot:g1610.t1